MKAYGLYRQAVHRLVSEHLRERNLPTPLVDAGGRAHKGEFQAILGRRIETWDVKLGVDVDRVVDLETCGGIADGYAGTLICTSVLEHVKRFWVVAEQIARVVRARGLLFVTAPWIFPYHEHPGDYWRFTVDGLRLLFGETFREMESGEFVGIKSEREGVWWMGERL